MNLELDDLSQIVDEDKLLRRYSRMKNNKVHSEAMLLDSSKGSQKNASKGS